MIETVLNQRLFIINIVLLLWCFGGMAYAADKQDFTLRVLLGDVVQASVHLSDYRRTTGNGSADFPASALDIKVQSQQLYINKKPVGLGVFFATKNGFSVGGTSYRGDLYALYNGGKIRLVNWVSLENYLLGVVPSEVPSYFPEPVIQAQAILARTYAISRLSPKSDYDICASEQCQVYKGIEAEHPKHTAAIKATKGLIVSYGGKPISALYHSDSGGYTATPTEVWGGDIPYLKAKPDPYSKSSNSSWQVTLTPQQIQMALGKEGLPVGTVRSLSVIKLSESGRPAILKVVGSNKTITITGAQISKLLRYLGLKATRGTFEGFTFYGQGSGHGVGMSQWGAKGMVEEEGWGFREILGYYYPGTFLSEFSVSQ